MLIEGDLTVRTKLACCPICMNVCTLKLAGSNHVWGLEKSGLGDAVYCGDRKADGSVETEAFL